MKTLYEIFDNLEVTRALFKRTGLLPEIDSPEWKALVAQKDQLLIDSRELEEYLANSELMTETHVQRIISMAKRIEGMSLMTSQETERLNKILKEPGAVSN